MTTFCKSRETPASIGPLYRTRLLIDEDSFKCALVLHNAEGPDDGATESSIYVVDRVYEPNES